MPRETDFKSKEEFLSALRDWFAGQALPAILSAVLAEPERFDRTDDGDVGPAIVRMAHKVADAMLAARKEGK